MQISALDVGPRPHLQSRARPRISQCRFVGNGEVAARQRRQLRVAGEGEHCGGGKRGD
jgi:hypothetical protein